ncbi:MAG: 5-(carboxyamino)imidazole ribonucleotide synthase [Woeseia sp.]
MTQLGILGAGQLGQMLGAAGESLGITCRFLDPADAPPAASVGEVVQQPFDDVRALRQLANDCAVITYEFENVPVAALAAIADDVAVYPPLAALQQAQDRVNEKKLFEELGIPLPRWWAVESLADLEAAATHVGLPLVLKTRRFGYDGKGQRVIRKADEFADALEELPNRPLVAEQWIAFEREVSAIGVRGRDGEQAFYPLTENVHRQGILHTSCAPFVNTALASQAGDYLRRLLDRLDYVGVLALECFVHEGKLLANEFAPRVHNSGHWTIEGAVTSQFENHLRAVLGMPLGSTAARGHAGMLNLIGIMPTDPAAIRATGAVLHDYGKMPRSGRKLGHITVVADEAAVRDRQISQLSAMLAN